MSEISQIRIERKIESEKKEVIWESPSVALVKVKDVWDSHGTIIEWGDGSEFKNASVRVIERTWREFGKDWKVRELEIDGKEYGGEILSVQGDERKLLITACVGAG